MIKEDRPGEQRQSHEKHSQVASGAHRGRARELDTRPWVGVLAPCSLLESSLTKSAFLPGLGGFISMRRTWTIFQQSLLEMTLSGIAVLGFSVTVYKAGLEEDPMWRREGRSSLPRPELEF